MAMSDEIGECRAADAAGVGQLESVRGAVQLDQAPGGHSDRGWTTIGEGFDETAPNPELGRPLRLFGLVVHMQAKGTTDIERSILADGQAFLLEGG